MSPSHKALSICIMFVTKLIFLSLTMIPFVTIKIKLINYKSMRLSVYQWIVVTFKHFLRNDL